MESESKQLTPELRKVVLFFSVIFSAWQVLYIVDWLLNGIDWLLAYSAVLVVITCFFLLDKQRASDLGLTRPLLWKRYIMVGFVFAVLVIFFWFSITLPLPFTVHETFRMGIRGVPYNALFALVVGLVEETAFRGYILRNLRKVYSDTKAMVYSAILFGFYHVSIVVILLSETHAPNPFTYWSSYVLFTFVVGLFQGYFCLNSEGTVIGTVTHHSSHIFLSSLIPYELAASFTIGHLVNTVVYVIVLVLLIFVKEKGWLRNKLKTA